MDLVDSVRGHEDGLEFLGKCFDGGGKGGVKVIKGDWKFVNEEMDFNTEPLFPIYHYTSVLKLTKSKSLPIAIIIFSLKKSGQPRNEIHRATKKQTGFNGTYNKRVPWLRWLLHKAMSLDEALR